MKYTALVVRGLFDAYACSHGPENIFENDLAGEQAIFALEDSSRDGRMKATFQSCFQSIMYLAVEGVQVALAGTGAGKL